MVDIVLPNPCHSKFLRNRHEELDHCKTKKTPLVLVMWTSYVAGYTKFVVHSYSTNNYMCTIYNKIRHILLFWPKIMQGRERKFGQKYDKLKENQPDRQLKFLQSSVRC